MAKTPTIRIHQGNTSHAHCNRIYKNAITTKEKYSKIKSDADFHAKICKKKNCGYLKYKVYFEKE